MSWEQTESSLGRTTLGNQHSDKKKIRWGSTDKNKKEEKNTEKYLMPITVSSIPQQLAPVLKSPPVTMSHSITHHILKGKTEAIA